MHILTPGGLVDVGGDDLAAHGLVEAPAVPELLAAPGIAS